MENHRDIEDAAAGWLAQLDSGEWSTDNEACLQEWLGAATAHRVAFLRLESRWEEALRARALSAGLPRGVVPQRGEWRNSPFFSHEQASDTAPIGREREAVAAAIPPKGAIRPHRHMRFVVALAATVLLAVGLGVYLTDSLPGDRYSTPIGGLASVPLHDGSNITLNTASQVRIDLTEQERRIQLDRGEAFFDVARDPNRPFVVQVGNKRVIAVGTKFSVRRDGADIRVAVAEGKVRVESGSAPWTPEGHGQRQASAHEQPGLGPVLPTAPRNPEPGEVYLTPGDVASANDAGVVVQERSLADVEDDLSWRQGYLTFHERPLGEIVAEFNRYNAHQIAVVDTELAATRISGTFRAVNYQAFVRVLDEGFAIHATQSGGTTTLTR